MAFKPLICLDFDGVLHSYESGWSKKRFASAHIADPPVPGAMTFLRELVESGNFKIAIHSSRSKTLWGRFAMQRWLRRCLIDEFGHQMGPHWDPLYIEILDEVSWPWFKPAASVTIDDRAITFTGEWPTLPLLAAFKPWNKR